MSKGWAPAGALVPTVNAAVVGSAVSSEREGEEEEKNRGRGKVEEVSVGVGDGHADADADDDQGDTDEESRRPEVLYIQDVDGDVDRVARGPNARKIGVRRLDVAIMGDCCNTLFFLL